MGPKKIIPKRMRDPIIPTRPPRPSSIVIALVVEKRGHPSTDQTNSVRPALSEHDGQEPIGAGRA